MSVSRDWVRSEAELSRLLPGIGGASSRAQLLATLADYSPAARRDARSASARTERAERGRMLASARLATAPRARLRPPSQRDHAVAESAGRSSAAARLAERRYLLHVLRLRGATVAFG